MRDTNSLNRVILIGNLGQNPEMKYLPQKERQVARFTLATNERFYNTATRETTKRTEWHKIVVWGKQAEFCEKYLATGKMVLVEGKLRTRSWQDKEGNKRTTTEIEAENIVLLGKREDYGAGAGAAAEPTDYGSRPQPQTVSEDEAPPFDDTESGGGGGTGDDVPF
jgi:single-strand DNA-binding protein